MTSRQALDWRLLGIFYALVVIALIARSLLNSATVPLLADTDDAMRLVVVRDFLAGQGWYDNIQHRMNTPFGAELHWSRLADLPLAALIMLLRPLLCAGAETAAAFVLPLIYLFGLLYLSGKVTIRLAGGEGLLPALALPALSLSVLGEFAPGRIDHHPLQVLLLLAMLWCAVEALERPRFALGAGLAAATSLALGVEGIPSVAACILAFGLMWVTLPRRADALRLFGISLGLATLFHLVISVPPARWLVPACDAISLTYAAAATGTGLAFLLLAALPLRDAPPLLRLGAGVAAGALLLLLLAIAFPLCLGGPYAALDPWLSQNWIDKISEALPLWQAIGTTPVHAISVAVPPLLALAAIGWRVLRGPAEGTDRWLVYAVFLCLAFATMLIQVRASRMVSVLAVPACAWLIVAARHRYLARLDVRRLSALLASWLGSAGMGVALIVIGVTQVLPGMEGSPARDTLGDRRQCVMPEAFHALAAIPPERLMTPVDLGSHMLVFTPHHVVAAPYHRNEDGVGDAFAFFNGPIEEGRAILDRRGISLVVTCEALPEMRGIPDAAADSFVRLAPDGALPDWLVRTSPPGETLTVYAVMPL